MITKLSIGERYNIIGLGRWSDIDMDIVDWNWFDENE